MDWKYKHFHQERVFAGEPDVVREAARSFMAQSLGWQIKESADGFTAEGYSFSHRAIANVRFQTVRAGTTLAVDLLVERAGATGFMLFDVGGYYNIQIRKWLDGIQWSVHQGLVVGEKQSAISPPPSSNKTTACLFNGCLGLSLAMFALWMLITLICAIVGLITGHLYLMGRGGTLVVHGWWARILSLLIVLFAGWIVWRLKRLGRKH